MVEIKVLQYWCLPTLSVSTVHVYNYSISKVVNSQTAPFVWKSRSSTTVGPYYLTFTPKIPWPYMQSGGNKCNKYCALNYHTIASVHMKLRWQRDIISTNSFLHCRVPKKCSDEIWCAYWSVYSWNNKTTLVNLTICFYSVSTLLLFWSVSRYGHIPARNLAMVIWLRIKICVQ